MFEHHIDVIAFAGDVPDRLAELASFLDPCMSEVFAWNDLPEAHMKMLRNEHKPGNMSVLVQAPFTGLRTFEDTLEASLKS